MNCPQCNTPLAPGVVFCSGCGAQVAAPPAAGAPAKTKSTAAWVIGCVIAAVLAVPVIGIFAAIAIPNFLGAIQRGKQKRTMGDMKTLASVLEQYNNDHGHYPEGRTMQEVCKALVPEYLVQCIDKDGWHSPQQPRFIAYAAWDGESKNCGSEARSSFPMPGGDVRADTAAGCGPRHYGLASAGKNGKWAVESFDQYGEHVDTRSFDADIVIIDGQFTQMPSGRQGNTPLAERYDRPPAAPAPSVRSEPRAPDGTPM